MTFPFEVKQPMGIAAAAEEEEPRGALQTKTSPRPPG